MEVELHEDRGKFGNSVEFLLTCISYGAGCAIFHVYDLIDYLHGGWIAAAILAFFSVLVAVPMIHLELSIGQIAGLGPSGAFAKMTPLFRGVGWAFGLVCLCAIPYQLLEVCRALVYFVASLRLTLSWTECGHWWNTIHCVDVNELQKCRAFYHDNASMFNNTCINVSGLDDSPNEAVYHLSTREFYRYYVNNLPNLSAERVSEWNPYYSFNDLLDWPQWQLGVAALLTCVACLNCLLLKPNLYGKGTAYKLLLGSVLVIVFLLVALPLLSEDEVDWNTMWLGMKEWLHHEADQTRADETHRIDWRSYETLYGLFFTYGAGFGAYITLASFHRSTRTKSWPVSAVAPMLIVVVSLLIGFAWGVLRATLTYKVSLSTGIPFRDINGFGDFRANYFIIPAAFSTITLGPLFSALYFLAYAWLLFARLLPVIWTVVVVLMDEFPSLYRRHCIVKLFLVILFLLGALFMCNPVGPQLTYFLYVFVTAGNLFCVVFIALLVVLFAYGWYNLQKDLALVLGLAEGLTCCKWWWGPISPLNTAAWFVVLPTFVLFFSTWDVQLDMKLTEELARPLFAECGPWVAWGITKLTPILIVLIAIGQFIYGKCRKEALLKPTADWAPSRLKQYLYVAKAPLGNERTCWCCCGYQPALYVLVGLEVVAFFLFLFYSLTNIWKDASAFRELQDWELIGEYCRYTFVGVLVFFSVLFLVTVALVVVALRQHSPRLLLPYLLFSTVVNAFVFVYSYELFHHLFDKSILETKGDKLSEKEEERYYEASGYSLGCLLFWLYRCFMLALAVGGHYLFRSEQPPNPIKDVEATVLLSEPHASAPGSDPFTAQDATRQFHISDSEIPLVDQGR